MPLTNVLLSMEQRSNFSH